MVSVEWCLEEADSLGFRRESDVRCLSRYSFAAFTAHSAILKMVE